jgi:hypothetical protein
MKTEVQFLKKPFIRRIIYLLCLLFILGDLAFSFTQFYPQTLDGDMSSLIVPASDVQPIFDDPFGIQAIRYQHTYVNPNRFFCHWMYREYMLNAPLFLQYFTDSVDSVYLAGAIAKTLIQALIMLLLAIAITGYLNIKKTNFIIAAALMVPLFQAYGYRSYMGIIDPSATYTFFYALPTALMIIYFLPFILKFYHGKSFPAQNLIRFLWIPFAIVVSLHGALNPGIALIFSTVVILHFIYQHFRSGKGKSFGIKILNIIKKLPADYWIYLLPISLFSLYSLYLGTYNSYSIQWKIPLVDMYQRLPQGVFYLLTQKPGYPLLLALILLNSFLIHKYHQNEQGKKLLKTFAWAGIFALIYILLLPLGGYREYRFNIIRYDTIMPVTLSLLFMYGKTTLFLFRQMTLKQRKFYVPLILLFALVYTNADRPASGINECEKHALKQIAASTEPVVAIQGDCTILSWEKISNPADSELNAKLLRLWNITDDVRLYYNQ